MREGEELRTAAHELRELVDLSPEGRRRDALRWKAGLAEGGERGGAARRNLEIARRVWTGVYNDGLIHAGNLAYMVMFALFPFFIVSAAVFSLIGETSQRAIAVNTVILALPPVVAQAVAPVGRAVIEARTGWLLWAGGLIGLWTTGSLIETVRDLLRRAYGTKTEYAYWRYRLVSTAIVLGATVLLFLSIGLQVGITAAQQIIDAWMPQLASRLTGLSLSRFVPAGGLFLSLYLLFYSLTPGEYRRRGYPKWPGALLVTVWWLVVTSVLPVVLRLFFAYDLTYGSLAGVMIALFFFWLVGLGMVVGAELNAALSETPEEQDMLGKANKRAPKRVDSKSGTNGE
ncbi:YihY/virulence factor BrkB family protein [Novosphingobium sp. ZN18A2]|uniref:YihY/virulence factor BrkB family protein n=1 Tax=Novosphingobium sp. ZN18A2 TaxID=3079861 RepID=UPI0030CF8CC1